MYSFDTEQNERNNGSPAPEEPVCGNEAAAEAPEEAKEPAAAPQTDQAPDTPIESGEEAPADEEGEGPSDGEGEGPSDGEGEGPDDEQPKETPAQDEGESENVQSKNDKKQNESPALFFFDVAELVAVSLAIVMLLLTFFARQSPVKGNSMYPTIKGAPESGIQTEESGKDILLISNFFYKPKSGDIVVIQTSTIYMNNPEESMDHSIVKRVIGVGGDLLTIDFDNWRIEIERNGEKTVFEEGFGKAPYVNYPETKQTMSKGSVDSKLNDAIVSKSGNTYTLKIPEGQLFVMGDNRMYSKDSRSIGFIDERWIAGKALLRIYPFDRFGGVE